MGEDIALFDAAFFNLAADVASVCLSPFPWTAQRKGLFARGLTLNGKLTWPFSFRI